MNPTRTLSAILLLMSTMHVLHGVAYSAPAQGKSGVATTPTPVYCKLCGQKYPDAKTLLRNRCPRNDGGKGKHEVFLGGEMTTYVCKNCGQTYSSLKDLTRNSCPHGNGSQHVPYSGGVQSAYICRYCGKQYKNLKDMTRNSCPKAPKAKGTHRPK